MTHPQDHPSDLISESISGGHHHKPTPPEHALAQPTQNSTPVAQPTPSKRTSSIWRPDLWQGRVLVVVATLLWSTNGLFAKNPMFAEWSDEARGPVIAFWRAFFAGLVLVLLARRPQFLWVQLPFGVIFAGLNITFMIGLAWTTTGNAIWLQATAPLWVFLINWLVFGQLPPRDQWPTLLFVASGIGLILSCEMSLSGQGGPLSGQGWGVLMSLTSGVCFAATVLLMRFLRGQDPHWVVGVNFLLAAALMAPLSLSFPVQPSWSQLATLAAFGVVQMGVPYVLFQIGLRHVSGQEAAYAALLEPILSPVWTFLAYGEQLRWWTLGGAALIFGGLLWQTTRPVSTPSR